MRRQTSVASNSEDQENFAFVDNESRTERILPVEQKISQRLYASGLLKL